MLESSCSCQSLDSISSGFQTENETYTIFKILEEFCQESTKSKKGLLLFVKTKENLLGRPIYFNQKYPH